MMDSEEIAACVVCGTMAIHQCDKESCQISLYKDTGAWEIRWIGGQ